MKKVVVHKTSSNDNTYRTPLSDIDFIHCKPIVGERFILGSTVHESGGVLTSVVQKVVVLPDGYRVHTENSIYKIEVLGEH